MSFSVLGWIEFRDNSYIPDEDEEAWHAVVDALWLLPQNHSTSCSCLFGIRNHSGWKPAFPTRGLPDDVSQRVLLEATAEGYFYYSATYLTWREVQEVNWDESVVDAFTHLYERAESGELQYVGARSRKQVGPQLDSPFEGHEGDSWMAYDSVYKKELLHKIERITRREAAWSAFNGVFELMAFFARRYGDDNVRLVVWFGE